MRVVAYARYSSQKQKEVSIEEQLREIYEYCEKHGYTVVDNYTDFALSGKYDYRPKFEQMLQDSKNNIFDAVIVFDLSRFSRGGEIGIADSCRLKENNIKLLSVTEEFDDSFGGKVYKHIKFLMNEEYIEQLKLNVARGQKDNAIKALWNGGTPPLGYDVNKDNLKLVINEYESSAVRLIFNEVAQGTSLQEVCNQLNKLGYRTKKYCKPFTKTSLYDLLRNEKYIGKYLFRKTSRIKKRGSGCKIKNDQSKMIIVEDAVPAIIDVETWEICQERLNANRQKLRITTKQEYLLAGLIKCGICGGRFVGNGSSRSNLSGAEFKTSYYVCNDKKRHKTKCTAGKLSKNFIEQNIIKLILTEVYSDKKMRANAQAYCDWKNLYLTEATEKLKDLQQQLKNIEERRERIKQGYVDRVFNKEEYFAQKNICDSQAIELNNQINLLTYKNKNYSVENIISALKKLKALIAEQKVPLKEIIQQHVVAVLVYPTEYVITLNMLPQDFAPYWGDDNGAGERT